jgi:hypothetical protein
VNSQISFSSVSSTFKGRYANIGIHVFSRTKSGLICLHATDRGSEFVALPKQKGIC